MFDRRQLRVVDALYGQHILQELEAQRALIERVAQQLYNVVASGGTIFWCGNGGSAAECQHLAAELIGRFTQERRSLASVALVADSSVLTAVANDYGYSEVFRRQVEGLCKHGDALICLSTSGESRNVCAAASAAAGIGALTVGMTGRLGGQLARVCSITLKVPADATARIQEAHLLLGHVLCEQIELAAFASSTMPEASGECGTFV